MPSQNDRVSYSFGMKLSLPAKYESADFHISLSSDVQDGETSTTAFQRIKREVETYAALAYQQIRNSEEGLPNEKLAVESKPEPNNKRDAGVQGVPEVKPVVSKPRDLKALKQQIKKAFGVLESQKKITRSDFVAKYLKNKKTEDLSEVEVTRVLVDLRENFPHLKL